MNGRGRGVILSLISGLLALVTILALNLLAHRSILQYQSNRTSREPVPFSAVSLPQTQQDQTDSHLYSSSNVLELPKASLDFVGYWGGSVRGSGPLTGESPAMSALYSHDEMIRYFSRVNYTAPLDNA